MTKHSEIYKIPKLSSSNSTKSNISYTLFVVVRKEEMNEMSETLLNNIIKAIKLPTSDLTKIILHEKDNIFHFRTINETNPNSKIILFGITSKEIGLHININKNKIINFKGHHLLSTSSLQSIMEEQEQGKSHAKMQLWKAIKSLFNI